jgi:photosystem II stability/assembly factor-like uncharacterized protein
MTTAILRLLVFLLPVSTAVDAQQFPADLFHEMHWRNIGPFRGGRTRAAEGVPSQPNVFYMGQVNGGVWKSDDYGRTWIPIFDDQPTQSIGAIAVAPSDPNIVYVASGEGLQRPDLSVGDGFYRSRDAGKTWIHLGLRDGQQIPALVIDPRDANHVYAAVLGHPYGPNAERGVFESRDGGATWTKSLYVDENTGASDIVMDAVDPNMLYAALWEARQGPWEFGNTYAGTHGGLFKSTDGGANWRKLSKGLPADLVQIYATPAPSNPQRLYATAASPRGVQIYRSDNAGEDWYVVTNDTRPATRIGGGDLPVPKVDPKNPEVVYSASIVTWRSEDGGKTWTAVKGAPGGDDYQNIWINPNNPEIILLVGDQGANVSVNRGRTWSSWYNQATAQLYHVAASNTFPYNVCGGQQESGSVCISTRGNDGAITFREWHPVGIIEYGYAAPDPLNPDIVYGAGRGQVSRFHRSTGQVEMITPTPVRDPQSRADRTQPILFSPVDPHTLYYAANVVFKTTDGGHSWQSISPDLTRPRPGIPAGLGTMASKDPGAEKQRGVVYSLAPSFQTTQTIWAGTDEGLIWVTRDGGANWNNVTPPELTPWSKITQMTASHFDDQTAYASMSRFRIDDLRPYVYRTHDGGKTWKLISAGLDNAPVDAVREDPLRKGLLFAGTETSVWVSFDDGDNWQPLQLNLPHTSMRDLVIHDNDLIVATHGRSFWVLDDITPLRQVNAAMLQSSAGLIKPATAYRVRLNTNTDTPLPPDEPIGENPPDGAVIDFWLGTAPKGPVTLEVLDGAGKRVRRYSSADKPDVDQEALEKLPIPPWWVKPAQLLPASAGLHRWVWDLHYATPDSMRHEYPISAVPHRTPRLPLGPRALPGLYTVKLTANDQSYTAPLVVKMDPRVKTSEPGLRQMFETEVRLAALMTHSTRAVRQARSAEEQIAELRKKLTGNVAQRMEQIDVKVKAELSPASESSLATISAQISVLYGEVDSADAAPTAAETSAAAKLNRDYESASKRWSAIVESIQGVNAELKSAGMSEIRLEQAPKEAEEDDSGDDDIG